MVRTIDGEARRLELAQAVWRIVEREGLAAASVRSVARESGLSTGSVRHFFDTQQSLIRFAMQTMVETVGDRIRQVAATGTPEERALAALRQLVPLTRESRAEAAAHLELLTAGRFDPGLAAIAADSLASIRDICRQAVTVLVDAGRLPRDDDQEARADLLAATLDGLVVRLLHDPDRMTPARADALLRHALGIPATEVSR